MVILSKADRGVSCVRRVVHARKSDATVLRPLLGSGLDKRPSASQPRTGSKILDYHGLGYGVLVVGRIGTGAGADCTPSPAPIVGNATCTGAFTGNIIATGSNPLTLTDVIVNSPGGVAVGVASGGVTMPSL